MIVNNKVGITLSEGGFRRIAHLGILQYLKETGIPLDAVSGASAGALIGAFTAEGYTPLEVLAFAKEEKFFCMHPGENCDIYLQPDEINRFSTFDTKRIDEIYEFGYKYAQTFEKDFLAIKDNQ